MKTLNTEIAETIFASWACLRGPTVVIISVFAKHLLGLLFTTAEFSKHFAAEWDLRMPPQQGPPGASPPRTHLLYSQFSNSKTEILSSEARLKGDVYHENVELMIYPDYSVDTQCQRQSLITVKGKLARN